MTIAEIKTRRAEILARSASAARHYLREQQENDGQMVALQEICPHDGNAVVCEVCGALIDRNAKVT